MTPDPRQVKLLVRFLTIRHGPSAPTVATQLVRESMRHRDEETARLWLAVANWLGWQPRDDDKHDHYPRTVPPKGSRGAPTYGRMAGPSRAPHVERHRRALRLPGQPR